MSVTPPLGEFLPRDGDHVCGFGLGPICGEPAIVHVVWDANGENGMACETHWPVVQREWAYYDHHEVGTDCNMPGSEIIWSWEEPPGRCDVEPEPEPEPVLVGTFEQQTLRVVLDCSELFPLALPIRWDEVR